MKHFNLLQVLNVWNYLIMINEVEHYDESKEIKYIFPDILFYIYISWFLYEYKIQNFIIVNIVDK